MLAIIKNEAPRAPIAVPTIAEIARSVPQGSALQMAQGALAAQRKLHGEIGEELEAVYAIARGVHGYVDTAKIDLLSAEIHVLEGKINSSREKTIELRLARADKVAAALVAVRLDAARRLVVATEELAASFNDLRACCEEIRRAGDPDQPHFHPPVIGLVLDHARRFIDRHSK